VTACLLCTEPLSEAPIVGTTARGGKPSRRVACERCTLVQVAPAPSADALAAYYATSYHADHGPVDLRMTNASGERVYKPGEPEYDGAIQRMHELRAEAVIGDLGLKPGARVLEVGCSDGRTLLELQKRGMVVYGLEPSLEKVAQSIERGVEAACESLDQACRGGFEAMQWDAVIAFHVLEHFPDPLEALDQMRSMLKPGGQIWVEVPNVLAPSLPLEHHWQWVHLFDFSRDTLSALFARAGLDSIKVRDNVHGKPTALQAWAVDGGEQPRAYAEHPGHSGQQIAEYLRALGDVDVADEVGAHAAIEAAAAKLVGTLLPRFMAGEALGPAEQEQLRAELRRVQASVGRQAAAWTHATNLVGKLSQDYAEECYAGFESWHPDPYTFGVLIGRAQGFHAAKDALAYVANAMKACELSDGAKEGEE
jgi:SAM-dependent methyltransferase